MVIDVKKLKFSGKEECSFHFEEKFDDGLITLPDAKFSTPVSVTGTLTLGGNEVYAEGEIEYSVEGACSRCAESAVFQKVITFDEVYSDSEEADPDKYSFAKGLVDLSEMVKEKIVLSMPFAIFCKDDCKGLCPVCGANLNITKCKCKE